MREFEPLLRWPAEAEATGVVAGEETEAPHAYEVCYGVSHETYSPGQRVITNGQMHTNQINQNQITKTKNQKTN